ncbi:type II toxin-antitoxin system PemK/MazF family toxin [Catenulispora sp. NF23]|uniref:Type II toxin-antitoxin system PemK/MazF family toxin n=1 Tax=Catenulispora pinistramenti TaxID=2705254 RepID=A0ABS5KLS1_9ACTN|nr:type II toxin-antitoxin system PemK/MazF family toxin [Catenulispora pinistramenti]MBS2531481.1 type II toxin-antitoxin system PemK/MazF family toxin [Catenulispora pinistramenti]MBS2546981.1 type II toxin-antitoxin system PemK/MazF family toxin [Catenulispora pinistramenti]
MSLVVTPWSVWWMDFDPQAGREQAGRRPAIVVGSRFACTLPNGLVLVVPCTSTDRGLPFQPGVMLDGRAGFAMCDQVKALSRGRIVRPHRGSLSEPEIDRIKFALRRILDV